MNSRAQLELVVSLKGPAQRILAGSGTPLNEPALSFIENAIEEAKASALVLATEGCCKGHKCDNCATCRKGRCCRRDNPDYKLPGLGEWDGPIYGELGVLNDDGDKVECHCCGKWCVALNMHVWLVHNLLADEYKSIFGLMRSRGLISSALRQREQQIGQRQSALYALRPPQLTPEQISANNSQPRRLQTQLSSVGRRTRQGSGNKHALSRFVGVTWDRQYQQWSALITRRYKNLRLGFYDTEEEAACAYDAKARELYGDAARLNFPDEQ